MTWRAIQKSSFTRLDPLLDFLAIEPPLREKILRRPRFPLNVPRRFAEKMAKNDLNDPLFRQFLPLEEESVKAPGFTADPVCDAQFCSGGRLLVKYEGRALLICTSACAMHCRYCFRQNYPYETAASGYAQELALIEADPTLTEILLSGGDPLSLSNDTLSSLIDSLARIPHVRRIRFHTRFPIGIPERIEPALLDILAKAPLQLYFVVHVNHPLELDEDVAGALKKIQKLGIPVLNQAVLLRGVNDSEEVLVALMQRLIDIGVLPYYLHQLDRVEGAGHFEVDADRGALLMRAIEAKLPGYALPRYVREIPGATSKTSIA